MTIHSIPIDQIHPNPYQTRDGEDTEHVARVAKSIAQVGLLQEPLARLRDGGHDAYELAYGHTRLAAYRLLDEQGEQGYDYLPLKLADLSDLEMFELAVRENSERKDLTPIEEAKAMLVYRDEFKKSSEEIGDLFGLAASTVRNKLRLLELPEPVQERVADRQLSEGTARSLLAVQKIAPEEIETMASDLAEGEYNTPDGVASFMKLELRSRENTAEMWVREYDGQEIAGIGLWPMDKQVFPGFTLNFGVFKKAYTGELSGNELKVAYEQITYEMMEQDCTVERLLLKKYDPVIVSLCWHLLHFPACSKCDFHLKMDGTHWCGLTPCFGLKKKHWIRLETERLSEELGIPIYDRSRDGRDYEVADYWGESDRWDEWFAERADHLRLKGKFKEWHANNLTESHTTCLISVRPEYQAEAEEFRQQKAEQEAGRGDRERQWEIERKNRELVNAFVWNVASLVFSRAFEGVTPAVLPYLADCFPQWDRDELPEVSREKIAYWWRAIANGVLQDGLDWREKEMGAEHIAGHLESVALTWGIDLPADWHELAQGYALEGVSTETEADDGDR